MKLTINIKDHKAAFFLELLQHFESFIAIEEIELGDITHLTKEQKNKLEKQLKKLQK